MFTTMRMTTNQKNLAKELQRNGISKHDSKIYAQNTSDFMFQTGVAYVSGVLTAATVGTARMVGHGIGWCVGKAASGIGNAIEKKAVEGVDAKAMKRAAKAAAKAEKKAEEIRKAAINAGKDGEARSTETELEKDKEETAQDVNPEENAPKNPSNAGGNKK